MTNCSKCNHIISEGLAHDECRTHALCSRERRYYMATCDTCLDLLEQIREGETPTAIRALRILKCWLKGFGRNSKNRSAGVDYFFDPSEREDIIEAYTMLSSRASVEPLGLPPPRAGRLVSASQPVTSESKDHDLSPSPISATAPAPIHEVTDEESTVSSFFDTVGVNTVSQSKSVHFMNSVSDFSRPSVSLTSATPLPFCPSSSDLAGPPSSVQPLLSVPVNVPFSENNVLREDALWDIDDSVLQEVDVCAGEDSEDEFYYDDEDEYYENYNNDDNNEFSHGLVTPVSSPTVVQVAAEIHSEQDSEDVVRDIPSGQPPSVSSSDVTAESIVTSSVATSTSTTFSNIPEFNSLVATVKGVLNQFQEDINMNYESTDFKGFSPSESVSADKLSLLAKSSLSSVSPVSSSSSSVVTVTAGSSSTFVVPSTSSSVLPSKSDDSDNWRNIPPGWILLDNKTHMLAPDGLLYGPSSIEIDDRGAFPRFKFKTLPSILASSSKDKGIIPVRGAFEAIATCLVDSPSAYRPLEDESFAPVGSSSNRAGIIDMSKSKLFPCLKVKFKEMFEQVLKKKNYTWDETTSPINVIPAVWDCIPTKTFIKFFKNKEYLSNDHREMLGHQLPLVPKSLLTAEFKARQAFHASLNLFLIMESVSIQKQTSDCASLFKAFSKLSLSPLFLTLEAFLKAKRDIRSEILKNCATGNVAVKKLLTSNPFVPEIFDPLVVKTLSEHAMQQSKNLLGLMGFSFRYRKRRARIQGRGRGAKRPRGSSVFRSSLDSSSNLQMGQSRGSRPYQHGFRGRSRGRGRKAPSSIPQKQGN